MADDIIQGGTIAVSAAGPRRLFELYPNGELEFDSGDDVPGLFWDVIREFDPSMLEGPSLAFQAGFNSDGTGGAKVILHRCGDVTGENYAPDDDAVRFWASLAAAWPKNDS